MTRILKQSIATTALLFLVLGAWYANARINNGTSGGGSSSSSATPGGSSGQLQYNNGGAFGGATGLDYGPNNSLIFSTSTKQTFVFENLGGGNLVLTGTTTGFTSQPTTTIWPYYKIHTQSSGSPKYVEFEAFVASGTDAYFDFYAQPGGAYLDVHDGTREIYLATDGDSYIQSLGQFGIGITTPTADLQVFATASTTVQVGDSTHTGCIVLGDSDGSGLTYVSAANGTLSATTTKPAYCR